MFMADEKTSQMRPYVRRDVMLPERPVRALLLAEQANPRMESVPLVGWSHARALLETLDAHLVTQVRNREALLGEGWIEGREFTAIDTEYLAQPLHRLAVRLGGGWTLKTAMTALRNLSFEHAVWRKFKSALGSRRFDLVHRITPVSPSVPSPLARRVRMLGLPFVLGPINGGLKWPTGYTDRMAREREWLSPVRSAYRLLPQHRATLAAASAILVGSRSAYEGLPAGAKRKAVYLPENAVDLGRFAHSRTRRAGSPLRICFVGRLVACKGVDLLLKAAAPFLRDGQATLSVAGRGAEEGDLRSLAIALGVDQHVSWLGWVPHEEVQDLLVASDVLALPSIREFGGGVVLEAMAVGLAPLVVNYGGPPELVAPGAGMVVPLGSPDEVVRNLGAALRRVVNSPRILDEMGARARSLAHSEFTWKAKAVKTRSVYLAALAGSRSLDGVISTVGLT